MHRIKTHKERVKSLFIVILSLSAVFLGLRTGLFDEPLRAGGFGGGVPPLAITGQASPAAFPRAIMASLGFGSYHGQRMDGQGGRHDTGLFALYHLFAGSLGEALGSSSPSEPVSLEAWETALTGAGVFFQYDVEISGTVLAGWLRTEVGGADGAMQRMVLSLQQGAVYLYYMGRDGIPHRSETAVDASTLHETLDTFEPNGAQYGFQIPAFTGADPFTLVLARYDGIPVITQSNTMADIFRQLDIVLGRFGMHLSMARYLDESGVRTMVEEGATLRLSESGLIHYHCQADVPRLAVWEEGERPLSGAIEAAREIAHVLERFSGEANVQLSNWYLASGYLDGSVILYFSYYLGGIPIWMDSPAATVVIRGRYVREVTLFARSFARTGEYSAVMPEVQAAAAAGEAELVLSYVSTEDDTLRTHWLTQPIEREEPTDG